MPRLVFCCTWLTPGRRISTGSSDSGDIAAFVLRMLSAGVERHRLARAGGAGDQHHAVGLPAGPRYLRRRPGNSSTLDAELGGQRCSSTAQHQLRRKSAARRSTWKSICAPGRQPSSTSTPAASWRQRLRRCPAADITFGLATAAPGRSQRRWPAPPRDDLLDAQASR